MSVQEIRGVKVVSVFIFFFGIFLITGLLLVLLVDLELIPSRMPQSIVYWRSRLIELDTPPKAVLGALIAGVCGGLVATIAALIYNLFATFLGGIKIDIE